MKLTNLIGPALLGTCLYGAVVNSFPTNEEKDAVGEIDATNEVERAGCAAALGLKTTLGLTQGEIVAAIRGVGGESVDGRVDVENVENGRGNGAMGHRALPGGRPQWGIRGAWDDDYYQAFAAEWVFPFGTNHLSGVVVYSQGGLAASSYDEPFVSLPVSVAIVPREGWFTVEQTASNSYVFAWRNVRPGRTAAETLDAQIELFRNGDYCVSTNGIVVEHFVRENPFPFAPVGQDDWYRAWVDEMVGVGLTNGLYKFTASFPVDPPEATLLTVGEESVVVTEAGEYVFLLEKGRHYRFGTIPFVDSVEYSYVDDLASSRRILRAAVAWGGEGVWTAAGGDVLFQEPTLLEQGDIRWMPTFKGYPDVVHIGPDNSPVSFSAILVDVVPSINVETFHWSSSSALSLSSSTGREVEVYGTDVPSWSEIVLNVSTRILGEELTSSLAFTYGTNTTPQVNVGLSLPSALLLRDDWAEGSQSAIARISFNSDVETNGVIRVSLTEGSDKVTVRQSGLGNHSFGGIREHKIAFPIDGTTVSSSVGDVTMLCEYLDANGAVASSVRSSLTVVSPKRISVNDDAVQDVAVLVGSPVSAVVIAEPTGSVIPSTLWYDAKLRSDRTYTGWRDCSEQGYSITRLMSESGIFIIKARTVFSGPQWTDVFYSWTADENTTIGIHRIGQANHIGVASTQEQLSLRSVARTMLGNAMYAYAKRLPAHNGFSGSGKYTWKCNAFVADVIISAGLTVPVQHHTSTWPFEDGYYPPLANEWARGNVNIVGWEHLGSSVWPEPGLVMGHPAARGSGHVGIVDFDGEGIAAGEYQVNRRYKQFLDGSSGYNRYIGGSGNE